MIYNVRNQSNYITESQKEKKTCFNVHFQYSQLKIMDNKVYVLQIKCDHLKA